MEFLAGLLHLALTLLVLLIVVRALIDYMPKYRRRFPALARYVDPVTEPVLLPLRRQIPARQTWNVDITPLIAVVIIRIVDFLLLRF